MLQQKNLFSFNSSGSNENYSVLFTWRNNHSFESLPQFPPNSYLFRRIEKKREADRGRKKYLEIIVSER